MDTCYALVLRKSPFHTLNEAFLVSNGDYWSFPLGNTLDDAIAGVKDYFPGSSVRDAQFYFAVSSPEKRTLVHIARLDNGLYSPIEGAGWFRSPLDLRVDDVSRKVIDSLVESKYAQFDGDYKLFSRGIL